MKMGEIRWGGNSDSFIMMTPDGVRPVILRCTTKGVVEVEEVAGPSPPNSQVRITQTVPGLSVEEATSNLARLQYRKKET